ncbi:hypothetical protein [Microbacterium gilvum]|uniref:DUF222 domain-containing protein n=1 Tax=Microbacterium gilvum TaxID=1336204 RepID=A0ABP9A5C0_9MICO
MTDNVREALEAAWDEGNGVGLDGWIGPGRGAGEVDDEALRARRRDVDAILSRFDVTPKGQAQGVIDAHMRQVAHRVMDVFQNADEDALADEVMADVFTAIGLVEAFGVKPKGQALTDVAALIAEARELVRSWDQRGSWSPDSPVGMVMQMADALERASQPVTEPTVEEWAARAQAARDRAIAKGYGPEHDAEHGIRHLLNWAIDYARRGRAEDSSGLILSALALLDSAEPVTEEQEHYPDCQKWPHRWVDCRGDHREDHDPRRPSRIPMPIQDRIDAVRPDGEEDR